MSDADDDERFMMIGRMVQAQHDAQQIIDRLLAGEVVRPAVVQPQLFVLPPRQGIS